MICRFSVENYKAFAGKIEVDFYANGNIKRFNYNHINIAGKNILKTAAFYGPNNTGKTCLLRSLHALKLLMLNFAQEELNNSFAGKNSVTSFEVEYCVEDRFYIYSVSFDSKTKLYIKEKLVLKNYSDGSSSNDRIFERSQNNLYWIDMNKELRNNPFYNIFSLAIPFMAMFDDINNPKMKRAKEDYLTFANSIVVVRMDGPLDVTKTIELMQKDPKAEKFIKEFVKNCDLHIDDFGFDDNVVSDANIDYNLRLIANDPNFLKETLKFYSKHNGHRVPSIFFDSVGTQKLIALSGYIYDALRNGKILIVDEIDSSLHHILTKSIVAMFSNMLNAKSQLVFTTHDVLLLDLKELFRKDQIWLVDVDANNHGSSKLCRLSEFKARDENGIRGDEDITEYYLKGQFGSIPTPDLFSSLEEVTAYE